MDNEKEIPFGAFDSELMHQEVNIPEGFEATIEGNKIILKKTESEDEKVREYLIRYIDNTMKSSELKSKILAWLEKQEGCEYIKKDWLEHIKQSWYKEGFIDGKYTPKELTINDVATLNELIDFLENGTVKLQHDLTLYANWLKTQFSPNEKQGEQKPPMQNGIIINGVEYELIKDDEADECDRCALKDLCGTNGEELLCTPIFGYDIMSFHRFEKRK